RLTNIWRLRDRTKAAREAGAGAVEVSLFMAFLPLTIFACGIVDYGLLIVQKTKPGAGVPRAGPKVPSQDASPSAPPGVIRRPPPADLSALLGVPAEMFTTSAFCTCADNIPVACPAANGAKPCADRVLVYVAVSASQTYTPLVPGTWSFPESVNARMVLRA